jgi:hypothetical protein
MPELEIASGEKSGMMTPHPDAEGGMFTVGQCAKKTMTEECKDGLHDQRTSP